MVDISSEMRRQRELEIGREVAHAFLSATTSHEGYRLALGRVTPLVRARFSSVFVRDREDETLLRLRCAHNWPQSSARYLGQLRLRVGLGPTGRAVAENRAFEVEDVYADPTLREWWEPARELGFVSLIALPLRGTNGAAGALTFYFDRPHEFADDERHLLMLVADQVAVTSERAEQLEALQQELEHLRSDNRQLEQTLGAIGEANRRNDELLARASHELRAPTTSILGRAHFLSCGAAGELTDEQRVAVRSIESSAHVLLRLISDLAGVSLPASSGDG
jgi:GAF domain-containing protein